MWYLKESDQVQLYKLKIFEIIVNFLDLCSLATLVEVYKRVRKSVILVCAKAQKGLQIILWLWKSRENVLVLHFIHILKTVHLHQLNKCNGLK